MIYYFQNATPSSREPMKIKEQQLDLYIERIIEAAASSLGDIVVRVSRVSALNSQGKILVIEVHHL